jgi:hypothetical protein
VPGRLVGVVFSPGGRQCLITVSRHLTDARRRGWRTLFQVIPAVAIAGVLDRYLNPTDENALVFVPLLAWGVAYAQNALEDHGATIPRPSATWESSPRA